MGMLSSHAETSNYWLRPRKVNDLYGMRYALLLLNTVLGDGMSSKLFQSVRESLGLVYTIYSSPEFLINAGVFAIGFATEPKDMGKAVKEINKQVKLLKKDGLSRSEMEFAKANLRGSILLGLESTNTRMANLSRQLMYGKHGESIYGTRGGPFLPASWGTSTRRGNTIYLHVLNWSGDKLALPAIPARVVKASVLGGGTAHVAQSAHGIEVSVPAAARDGMDTVVALQLDSPAAALKTVR